MLGVEWIDRVAARLGQELAALLGSAVFLVFVACIYYLEIKRERRIEAQKKRKPPTDASQPTPEHKPNADESNKAKPKKS